MRIHLLSRRADPAAAWRVVADTDHLWRIGGGPPMEVKPGRDDHGLPIFDCTWLGPAGLRHHFSDDGISWVQGRYFELVRAVEGPVIRRMRYRGELVKEAEGVRAQVELEMEPASPLQVPLLRVWMRALRRRWAMELAQLPAPGEAAHLGPARELDGRAQKILAIWETRGADRRLVSRAEEVLRHSHEWELAQLRPFALARHWGQPPLQVLDAFLDAAATGVLDPVWLTRCPRCRAEASRVSSWAELVANLSCPWCDERFEVDLDEHVEVRFVAGQALGLRTDERYGTTSPVSRPEIAAWQVLGPGEEADLVVDLAPGEWELTVAGRSVVFWVDVGAEGEDRLQWRPDLGGRATVRAGELALHLQNPTSDRLTFTLGSVGAEVDSVVTGARLACWPRARHLLGPPNLSEGSYIRTSRLVVLVADLTGSSLLFERLGDRAACALAARASELMKVAAATAGGVRIKAIADSSLFAFYEPRWAADALPPMFAALQRFVRSEGLEEITALRVGLHAGPMLASRSNATGFDLFGGVVNRAWRCCGAARPGEGIWTAAMDALPEVRAPLEAAGWNRVPGEEGQLRLLPPRG